MEVKPKVSLIFSLYLYLANKFTPRPGLGLHLKSLAQQLPQKFDLHERHRQLSELDEYDHLRRLLRLCTAHIFRNIRKCSVPEPVRCKMRGLVCMEHSSWDETVDAIEVEGGKAGSGEPIFIINLSQIMLINI